MSVPSSCISSCNPALLYLPSQSPFRLASPVIITIIIIIIDRCHRTYIMIGIPILHPVGQIFLFFLTCCEVAVMCIKTAGIFLVDLCWREVRAEA